MVEYGGGINNGPAGQVGGGGGGTPDLGTSVDFFSSVGHLVDDAANMLATAPPEMLVLAVAIFFVGLAVLRRAF